MDADPTMFRGPTKFDAAAVKTFFRFGVVIHKMGSLISVGINADGRGWAKSLISTAEHRTGY